MLLVSQFPLCDLRAFSPTGPARLRLPLWPQPDPAVTFVRHFGSVERRRRGGHDYWPDEAYFCSSRHALKFPNLDTTRLGRVAAGNGSPRSALIPRCAFRRLLCDGKAVVRVEVGLTNQSRLRSKPNVQFDGHSCLALVADFLSMPAQVTSFSGDEGKKVEVAALGGPLARLFEHATAPQPKNSVSAKNGWVSPCEPMLLVEYRDSEITSFPAEAHIVDPTKVGRARLGFIWRELKGRSYGCWLLCKDGITPVVARRIRLGLLRLHAEHQVLRRVLASVLDSTLSYSKGSDPSNRLDSYLDSATAILSYGERGGIDLSALQEVIVADDIVNRDDVTLLSQRLREVRRQILVKVESFLDKESVRRKLVVQIAGPNSTLIAGEAIVDNSKNTTQTQTISGGTFIGANVGVAQHFDRVNQRINQGNLADNNKQLLEELQKQVKSLVEKLAAQGHTDVAEDAAKRLDQLTVEATSSHPDKGFLQMSADGLIKAAKTVAEMAPSIISVVTKVLALFP